MSAQWGKEKAMYLNEVELETKDARIRELERENAKIPDMFRKMETLMQEVDNLKDLLRGCMTRPMLCLSCGEGKARAPHICPFKADIHGDEETLCLCCEDCTEQCWMDR